MTYDNGAAVLFVDGDKKASMAMTAFLSPAGWPMSVSGYSYAGQPSNLESLARNIDEVRYSNVVRYTGDFTPPRRYMPDSNTLALWHFDEGSGSTGVDDSGNGRHLTVKDGMAWTTDDCYGVAPDAARCGDGKKAMWEECDDGDTDNHDGCLDTCALGPVNLTCGTMACSTLAGYTAACNAQQHCEYTNVDPTGWRQWDVWIWIPPGTFAMGSPAAEASRNPDEGPVHAVTLATGYFIGKYEVTTATYAACQAASPGTCTPPSTADWDGLGWGTNTISTRSDNPQNGITWAQAGAVCAWLGGRQPSEAEWEYAAGGPTHRKYPWGDAPEASCAANLAVYDELGDAARPWACDSCTTSGCSGTKAVGSKTGGASWSGALDMAGNVWEWCQDWYHSDYTGAPSDGSAWVSPVSANRVLRGNGFTYGTASHLRSAARAYIPPGYRDAHLGVRCVRSEAIAPVQWTNVLSEDFSDNLAQGWTTGSTCKGCAGLGCPYVTNGVYQMKGDWNYMCLPNVDANSASVVAFEFKVNVTVKTSHWLLYPDKSGNY